MHHSIRIVFFLFVSLFTLNAMGRVGSVQKIEGSCTGSLVDGTSVSFTYYSNFDGCKKVSKCSLAFHSGIEGLITGSRSFPGNKDYYNFRRNDLTLLNSTGNTSAQFGYRDSNNARHVISVQCEVRDYTYEDC